MLTQFRKESFRGYINCFLFVTMVTVFVLSTFHSVVAAASLADITITGNGVSVYSASPNTTFMMLRIKGPQGIVFDESSNGTPLVWAISSNLSDGLYKWEVKASTATPRTSRSEDSAPVSTVQPWSSSGSFFISNNAIVPATEESGALETLLQGVRKVATVFGEFLLPSAHADQVILDDLIIDGSACVGQDCVNGESFGFDTIRLKENNLRIRFVDTSSTSSFPSRDWQITVNDSANGGQNKFAIDDIDGGRTIFTLEAGAPSNSLYVDDGGRVGFGTSTPVVDLHVKSGNTPTLRLEQDGSSGFTPQTWDVASNEANFFIRDATNGSQLPFRIQPGADTNTLYLNNEDNVGIGTNTPVATLHLWEDDSTEDTIFLVDTSANNSDPDGSSNNPPLFKVEKTGNTFVLGNLEVGSSRSLKENIQSIKSQEALAALQDLSPVHFSYRTSPNVHSLGFIAEDVPDIVATRDRKSLRPMDLVALLTKVTQEQQKSIEILSGQVAALQLQVQRTSGIQE